MIFTYSSPEGWHVVLGAGNWHVYTEYMDKLNNLHYTKSKNLNVLIHSIISSGDQISGEWAHQWTFPVREEARALERLLKVALGGEGVTKTTYEDLMHELCS